MIFNLFNYTLVSPLKFIWNLHISYGLIQKEKSHRIIQNNFLYISGQKLKYYFPTISISGKSVKTDKITREIGVEYRIGLNVEYRPAPGVFLSGLKFLEKIRGLNFLAKFKGVSNYFYMCTRNFQKKKSLS